MSEPTLVSELLRRAQQQDSQAIAELLDCYRGRIRKMLHVRLEPMLRTRVDPSDIIQETLLEAARRLPQYLAEPQVSFFLWLRRLAIQKLIDAHRRHWVSQKRSVQREMRAELSLPDESALLLVDRLVAPVKSASQQLLQDERRRRVRDALVRMPDDEREVLVLRYLEELEPGEISQILGISERTFWRRHRRALERLADLI